MESSNRPIDAKKLCYLLNISGFMDFTAVGMIMPLILTHIRELGASPTLTGIVASVYGGVQLFSGPLMGKFSDMIGRHPSLLLSMIMTAVGYFLVGISSSILLLVFARFILGCFKQNQGISKAYIYDILPEKESSAAIGRFHSFSSIGFILGPIIGGHIADTDGGLTRVGCLSATIFLFNAGLIWWAFPHGQISSHKADLAAASAPACNGNSHQSQVTNTSSDDNASKLVTTWKQSLSLQSIRSSPLIEHWDLLLVRFLGGLSIMMYRNNLTLNLREMHGVSKTTLGYMTSYMATVSAIFGFTIGFITKRYKHNEGKLFFHAMMLTAVTLVCLSLAPTVPIILIFLTPLSICTSIMRVSSTSELVEAGGKQHVAAILGWNQSINSVARLMAPTLVGVIQEWSMDGPSYFSVVTVLLAVILIACSTQRKTTKKRE